MNMHHSPFCFIKDLRSHVSLPSTLGVFVLEVDLTNHPLYLYSIFICDLSTTCHKVLLFLKKGKDELLEIIRIIYTLGSVSAAL